MTCIYNLGRKQMRKSNAKILYQSRWIGFVQHSPACFACRWYALRFQRVTVNYSILLIELKALLWGGQFHFWGEEWLENLDSARILSPTAADEQGSYFFQSKSSAWYRAHWTWTFFLALTLSKLEAGPTRPFTSPKKNCFLKLSGSLQLASVGIYRRKNRFKLGFGKTKITVSATSFCN